MSHEVSPYPDGCRIEAEDPRSYCECFAACAPGPVPAFQYVLNIPGGQDPGWAHVFGRWLLPRTLVGPNRCDWFLDGLSMGERFEFHLIKVASGGSPSVNWDMKIQEYQHVACKVLRQVLSPVDEICCQALDYEGSLWTQSCVGIPPLLQDVSLWPVPWDFTTADL